MAKIPINIRFQITRNLTILMLFTSPEQIDIFHSGILSPTFIILHRCILEILTQHLIIIKPSLCTLLANKLSGLFFTQDNDLFNYHSCRGLIFALFLYPEVTLSCSTKMSISDYK